MDEMLDFLLTVTAQEEETDWDYYAARRLAAWQERRGRGEPCPPEIDMGFDLVPFMAAKYDDHPAYREEWRPQRSSS